MRIRAARLEDAAEIAELTTALGSPGSAEDLARRLGELEPREHLVLVVEEAGRVAGWVHVFRSQRLQADPFAELGGLIVTAEARGRGLGRALLQRGEAWARNNGCARLRVRSRQRRAAAHRFYERVGYQPIKKQQVFDKDLGRSDA